MFKYNIIVTEFNLLYQILFEINDYLKFNLSKTNLKDINKIDISNSIILSKFIYKDELIKEKKINSDQIIFFLTSNESIKNINDYKYIIKPFNIDNFLEKINVQLLKKNLTINLLLKFQLIL